MTEQATRKACGMTELKGEGGDEIFIGGEPADGGELGGIEPSGGFVFQEGQVRVGEGASETVHSQMKSGIVVVDSTEKRTNGDVGIQFFAYLTYERLLGCLTGFDLTAGELPPILPLAISTLGGEDTTLGIIDDSGYNGDGFHGLWVTGGRRGVLRVYR
jgi:hypothetical protein